MTSPFGRVASPSRSSTLKAVASRLNAIPVGPLLLQGCQGHRPLVHHQIISDVTQVVIAGPKPIRSVLTRDGDVIHVGTQR